MDRITKIRIRNARAIESIDLELSQPTTVLIGENGSGKSTIIECLELLRKAAEPTNFLKQVFDQHGGPDVMLLRQGAPHIELGVSIADDAGAALPLHYEFEFAGSGIIAERLLMQTGESRAVLFERTGRSLSSRRELSEPFTNPGSPHPAELALSSCDGEVHGSRVLAMLRGIEVHLPFDSIATWGALAEGKSPSMRAPTVLQPMERLALRGANVANAWAKLKNLDRAHWERSMDLVRLGLGQDVDSVNVMSVGAGYIYLTLKRGELAEPIPLAMLSDGQLAWLAFVAMVRLPGTRSLLAVDEPELHMHPPLLGGVVTLLAEEAGCPVLLATHADRVLELTSPDALRVCELERGTASLRTVDPTKIDGWMKRYSDLAGLRASGYLSRALATASP